MCWPQAQLHVLASGQIWPLKAIAAQVSSGHLRLEDVPKEHTLAHPSKLHAPKPVASFTCLSSVAWNWCHTSIPQCSACASWRQLTALTGCPGFNSGRGKFPCRKVCPTSCFTLKDLKGPRLPPQTSSQPLHHLHTCNNTGMCLAMQEGCHLKPLLAKSWHYWGLPAVTAKPTHTLFLVTQAGGLCTLPAAAKCGATTPTRHGRRQWHRPGCHALMLLVGAIIPQIKHGPLLDLAAL